MIGYYEDDDDDCDHDDSALKFVYLPYMYEFDSR